MQQSMMIGPGWPPPWLGRLMGALAAAFFVQALVFQAVPGVTGFGLPEPLEVLAIVPQDFWGWFMVWQPLTSLFLHADLNHLVLNLFVLWMFGTTVAETLGMRRFLLLFFGAGFGAGLIQVVLAGAAHLAGAQWSWLPWTAPTIGASGAIMAVLTYFSLRYPRRPISLLLIPFALDAFWLVPLELLMEFGFAAGQVAHVNHVGGVICGWLFFRYHRRLPDSWFHPRPRRPQLRVVGGGRSLH